MSRKPNPNQKHKLTKTVALYALYRGDEFIDVGTIKELVERTGYSSEALYWWSTEIAHSRDGNNQYTLVWRVGSIVYERKTTHSPWEEKCVI